MEKEELEKELEKAEKGCVITVVNQSAQPLVLDGTKHQHGKFRARPPKSIISRETATFSLEGRKSIEASVRFRWGKGKLELFWNLPELGDPKIFYKVGPTLKNKIFVYIPSAVFGRVTKFIFLVDEKPVVPLTQQHESNTNTDTNDDLSSENFTDGEGDMPRTNSNGDFPIPISPKPFSDPSQPKSGTSGGDSKEDDDESKGMPSDPSSFGFSDSDEEENEPKRINIIIKPKSEAISTDTVIAPITALGPPGGAPVGPKRRRPTINSSLFPDINEQLFQTAPTTPPLIPTPVHSPPVEQKERRLSLSGELERNKFSPGNSRHSMDNLYSLTPPPHLTTPPLNPSKPIPFNSPSLQPTSPTMPLSPTPSTSGRSTPSPAFDLKRISLEDLRSVGLPGTPLTPKPGSTPDLTSLSARSPPLAPTSPPVSLTSPPMGLLQPTSPVLIPNKTNHSSPSKSSGSVPTSTSPMHYRAPLSPPLSHRPSFSDGGPDMPNVNMQRRFSEPPPVDMNLLFPELTKPKEANKKPDVLDPARKYIQAAMLHLEKNSIPAALGNLDLCVSLLATLPEETTHELEYCMRYRIFFILLKELAKPKPPMEHAFLSFFLSDLAVKPQHRIIAIRMAIRHNLTSSNFGIAANLIQFLVDRVHPVDENALQEKLRKCTSSGRLNSDKRFKAYTCPACEGTAPLNFLKCSLCQHPVKLCVVNLEMIATKAYYCCKLCKLNFSRKAVSPKESDLKCPFCKVGDLANKIFGVK